MIHEIEEILTQEIRKKDQIYGEKDHKNIQREISVSYKWLSIYYY